LQCRRGERARKGRLRRIASDGFPRNSSPIRSSTGFGKACASTATWKIAEFAVAQRLPSMFGWSEYCDAGGLMSYGANQRAAYVRLAAFADKLLHGAKPADLPIEQPTRFELVLNLRTATRLGITIPPLVVQRAERLIE
jgi:ABC-type uncharacterized transport system substrate-binding protein